MNTSKGLVSRPNPNVDPQGAKTWAFNDTYAKVLITDNMEPDQMVYVDQCDTSHEIWECLEAVHEPRGHQTITSYIRNLIHTTANEDDNIIDHLVKLKRYWERINRIADDDFKISDSMFKVIISLSLPPTWDAFIEPYVGGQIGHNPKHRLSSQNLIRLIKEEYIRREQRNHPSESTIDTAYETNRGTHKSLAMRISKPGVQPKPQNNLY